MKSKMEVSFIVRRICENFSTPIPEIRYTWKGSRGNANFQKASGQLRTWLNLPIATWTGIEQLITHETAHLVHFARTEYRRDEESHGVEFTKILIEVAGFMKIEFAFDYNFGLEYPSVARAAGVQVMPYGIQRKKEAAINAAMLLGITRSEAIELVERVERMK